jgi:hypothetical protein
MDQPFLQSQGFAKNQFVGRAQILMSLSPYIAPSRLHDCLVETEQTTGQPSKSHLFEVTSYTHCLCYVTLYVK